MRREYVPYNFDWRGLDRERPSIAHCTGCHEDFETHHCIRVDEADGELVQHFSHLCPRCDTLDHVFGVSHPPEKMTLRK